MRPFPNVKNCLLFFVVLSVFASCKKDNVEVTSKPLVDTLTSNEKLMMFMDTVMHSEYYWSDSVPNLDFKNYTDPYTYLEDLKYKKLDRWSFMMTKTQSTAVFEEGSDEGYGFLPIVDRNTYVTYLGLTIPQSPIYNAGIRRGYKLLSINDKSTRELFANNLYNSEVVKPSCKFVFLDTIGNLVETTVIRAKYKTKTVLFYKVYKTETKSVAYLVLNSFIQPTIDELNIALTEFRKENVNEFILDMRYNGGGLINVATYLSSMLLPAAGDKRPFLTYHYNQYSRKNDFTLNLNRDSNALNLSRLFVITTSRTASASELIINCLRPYMEVILVGGKTHGKPTGMKGKPKNEYVIYPVVFKIVNSKGYGDFFDGIPVNYHAFDNVTQSWGSESEDCFRVSIDYIKYGTFKKSGSLIPIYNSVELYGLRDQLGCF